CRHRTDETMAHDSNHASRAEVTDALRERLLNALHLGRASPGHRLPSVRELAREYGVDAKVVSFAYRVLSGEGLVELRARSGAFVAKPSALAAPRSSRDWLVDALVEARRRGISPRKAIEFVATATTSAPMRALIIDRNHDQLWSMSR